MAKRCYDSSNNNEDLNNEHLKLNDIKNYKVSDFITNIPTCTIVINDLPNNCTEQGLIALLRQYGKIKQIKFFLDNRAVLIEFQNVKNTKYIVQLAKKKIFFMGSQNVTVNYSSKNASFFNNKDQSNISIITSYKQIKKPDFKNHNQHFQQPAYDISQYYNLFYQHQPYYMYNQNYCFNTSMFSQTSVYNPYFNNLKPDFLDNLNNNTQQNDDGLIIEITNLPLNFTYDNIFNLLCMYGNIICIGLSTSEKGKALVQVENVASAKYMCHYYNEISIFGYTLRFAETEIKQINKKLLTIKNYKGT